MSYDASKGVNVVLAVELENTAPTELSHSVSELDRLVLDSVLSRNEPEAVLEVIAGLFFSPLEDIVKLQESIEEKGIEVPETLASGTAKVSTYAEQTAITIYAAAQFVKALNDRRRGTESPEIRTVVDDDRGAATKTETKTGSGAAAETRTEAYTKFKSILDQLERR